METLSKEQKQAKQVSEIDALRMDQKTGKAKKIKANKDESIEIPELFNDRYVYVRAITKHLSADQKSHDQVVSLIPIHAGLFDQMVEQGAFANYDGVKIVHDPRDNAKTDYNFKVTTIDSRSVENPSQAKSFKTSDMSAINEARKLIENQKATLENKSAELSTKEATLSTKESELASTKADLDKRGESLAGLSKSLSDKEAELAKREQEIADREKALKGDGDQKKK